MTEDTDYNYSYKYNYNDDLIDDVDYTPWHIKACNENPIQFKCKRCGGNQFNISRASYWTGARCPVCGWETCIHDG